MHFEFATASRIVFGPGTVQQVPAAAKAFGQRALLVVGGSGRVTDALVRALDSAGVAVSEFHVPQEPTVELVLAGLDQARAAECALVIAVGGGSVIDAAKAIAALLANPGTIFDYLEVVGKGQALPYPSVECIAVPTTAGTGSEVTRNAVIAVKERRVKVSLRGPSVLPRLAIVDPELTYSLPASVTATSGLDALTQLIEPFLSTASNPMTDAVCREGIRRVARSLKVACEHPDDHAAREDMALASLFSGMALANAKLGAVHGFAGPIGGMFPASHGSICARLLPVVLEINLRALRQRVHSAPVLDRFAQVAQLLTSDPQATPEAGALWLRELCTALHVPPLAAHGVSTSDFTDIIAQAKKASSMKGNPIELTDEELTEVLESAL
jgi:alcohol dehydrogenase class IV